MKTVGFIPPVYFGSTQAGQGVTGVGSTSIVGKGDDEIVALLRAESPHSSSSKSTNALAVAYTPYIGDSGGQALSSMFRDLYRDDQFNMPSGMMDAMIRRYIVTDNENTKGYKQGPGYTNLGMHPLVAQVAQLYHSDLGTFGYRYRDLPEAKEAFPVLFQVMDLPDKARAAKLLSALYRPGEVPKVLTKIVDKFITDVLPNRKSA